MTSVAAIQWRKEFRELFPFWCATVITMIVCWALMRPDLMPADWLFRWALGLGRNFLLGLGLIAYAAGAVTLGAQSIGNEYSHGTLTQLLVHPAPRGRILRVKLVVLALMLAALGALAFAAWAAEPAWAGMAGGLGRKMLIIVPLACGLLLAPWLTMVGHSPLGGAAFAAALPSVLWLAAVYIQLPAQLLWASAAVVAVIGPVMTWRTFMRLELAGSTQTDGDLSTWFSRSGEQARVARIQHPMWALVKKELRLQQGTLAVSGLYLIVWLVMVADRLLGLHALTNSPMFVATFVNAALVPLFCGAVASASERQFGVAQWQTLLPVASWQQWAIKAGVTVGTALALAIGLPMLLASIATETGWRDGMEPMTIAMLSIVTLYVSTLSSSPLRALLLTVPAIAVAFVTAAAFTQVVGRPLGPVLRWLSEVLPFVEITRADFMWWMRHGVSWLAAGLLVLLLVFGHTNHRTVDRKRGLLLKQYVWLSAYAAVAYVFISLLGWLHAVWQTLHLSR